MTKRIRISHPAADALDWNEAVGLVGRLTKDGQYRDSMLIATGIMLGLRVSDFTRLRWDDIIGKENIDFQEMKTGKIRKMRINKNLREHTELCYHKMEIENPHSYIFNSHQFAGKRPISRIRVHQILKRIQTVYEIKSAKVFSSHSLRKTFGRRIWLNECKKGRGDQSLELLKELFGHENVMVTKRYLGIRQEEILSLYDKLTDN